ncbi:hypothetical protein MPSEU_000890000 [Mayamaea pseudoterrestris]|nr:hypothetical protein MPSEU_000890000 [Mayamaea pseudoterrestris]
MKRGLPVRRFICHDSHSSPFATMVVRLRTAKHHQERQNHPLDAVATEKSRMIYWTPRCLSIIMVMLLLGSLSRRQLALGVVARQQSSAPTYKTIRAHVVHRHGDRTPITPLLDEEYWRKTLIRDEILDKIAVNTKVLAPADTNKHAASGRGPFGKLTELGLLQMIKVGGTLRERFTSEQIHARLDGAKLFLEPLGEVHPTDLQVYCTNFERTIQSVQGLLVGLFPDPSSTTVNRISIDARNTNWMIPDPQPRQSPEQSDLEKSLSSRPHILEREQDLKPLAIRATKALRHLLAADAHEISFGVDGDIDNEQSGSQQVELQPLGWNQLAEITKCLSVRELLPEGIGADMVEKIGKHAAWRWFENLTNERLVHLAMHKMSRAMIDTLMDDDSKRLVIWSAHDSTLIGLLCAFRLQMPAVWPEYASSIVVELIEASSSMNGNEKERFVRFSLNGEQLNCEWKGEPVMDMIPVSMLSGKIGSTNGVASIETL